VEGVTVLWRVDAHKGVVLVEESVQDRCEVSAVHEKVAVYTTSNRDGVAARHL
jgi:hypothetical protein